MNVWHRNAALAALVTGVAGAFAVGGCSSAGFGDASSPGLTGFLGDDASVGGFGASNSSGSSSGSSGSSMGGIPAALPPEKKAENRFLAPVATGNVVWIANPTSGRVAYIDAATFDVQTIQAGTGPTYLAAVPDATDDVIVLNVISQDATLLRRSATGITTTTFPSTADANSWAISAHGRWAIAWTDATQVQNTDPAQGFQEVAVMDLSGQKPPTLLAVGYRPSQFAFSGEDHAFAVTQDGISVIDLLDGSAPTVTQTYGVSASLSSGGDDAGSSDAGVNDAGSNDAGSNDAGANDAGANDAGANDAGANDAGASDAAGNNNEAGSGDAGTYDAAANDAGVTIVTPVPTPGTPDVSFTSDGAYALVRQDGLSVITVVSLKDGTLTAVPLPSAPTDLTLSPTGAFAVAALRDTSSVAVLPLPGIVSNPTSFSVIPIPGEVVGRAIVTQSGKTALLFTTVGANNDVTVLDLSLSSFHTIHQREPILAVFPAPDGQNAIVLYNVTPNVAARVGGAFGIVPLESTVTPLGVTLPAPPTDVAFAPTSDRAIVSFRDDATSTYGLYLALMAPQQAIPENLASPPTAVGIVAGAERGYAAQDFPEGRITFVDLYAPDGGTSVAARTITGFELGARVVNGAKP